MVLIERVAKPKRIVGCFRFFKVFLKRKRSESLDYLYRNEKVEKLTAESLMMLEECYQPADKRMCFHVADYFDENGEAFSGVTIL